MTAPLLKVNHLGLRLGERQLLANVTFELAAGEQLSIIGPNGAGKTTLLRCLLGLLPEAVKSQAACWRRWLPWRRTKDATRTGTVNAAGVHERRGGYGWTGTIQLQGQELAALRSTERARLMAHVPQGEDRLPPFSVQAFVRQGRYARPEATQAEHDNAVERSLRETGLWSLRTRPLAELSGGERQKALLAGALAQEPLLLVLDEPAAYLDPAHEQALRTLLERLRHERQLAVIAVSHNINSVLLTDGPVLALYHGQARFFAHSKELAVPGELDTVFGTNFVTVAHPRTGERLVLPDRPRLSPSGTDSGQANHLSISTAFGEGDSPCR